VETQTRQNADTQWNGVNAPPISAQASPPVLIKEFGMEAISAKDAGVKVTGVMGNSRAQKGGLQAGDIITKIGTASVQDIKHFQQLMSQATPEANVAVEIVRDGRTRQLSVMVGEGELEGVTPIIR
jgi:S1-C subfamily serine protease